MSIESEIARITEAVNDQTELIGRIASALDGKVAGGSGGYKSGDIVKEVASGRTSVGTGTDFSGYEILYGTELTVTNNKIYIVDENRLKPKTLEDLEILRGKYLGIISVGTNTQSGGATYIPEDVIFTQSVAGSYTYFYASAGHKMFIIA